MAVLRNEAIFPILIMPIHALPPREPAPRLQDLAYAFPETTVQVPSTGAQTTMVTSADKADVLNPLGCIQIMPVFVERNCSMSSLSLVVCSAISLARFLNVPQTVFLSPSLASTSSNYLYHSKMADNESAFLLIAQLQSADPISSLTRKDSFKAYSYECTRGICNSTRLCGIIKEGSYACRDIRSRLKSLQGAIHRCRRCFGRIQ